jgi:hypothetical protein
MNTYQKIRYWFLGILLGIIAWNNISALFRTTEASHFDQRLGGVLYTLLILPAIIIGFMVGIRDKNKIILLITLVVLISLIFDWFRM